MKKLINKLIQILLSSMKNLKHLNNKYMEPNEGIEMGLRALTFGEKAVGITFNPGGSPVVNEIKTLYAKIIDNLNAMREDVKTSEQTSESGEKIRLLSVAITDAQTAQMWAVKAITWNL